jgi:choice-of-anchor B domain-containing protein
MSLTIAACGGGGGGNSPQPITVTPPPSFNLGVGPAQCVGGVAAGYSCNGLNLQKNVSLATLGGPAGNDIWGWTDPGDGAEYALMGLTNGTVFVRIDDPQNPVIVGHLPTQTVTSTWRDIKVYENHAYIVADDAGAHGMQIFDLTRLRGSTSDVTFTSDVVYSQFNNAHNVVINEDSGFAYIVGTNTCDGGLHMVDISLPENPIFVGCHEVDGDTHDGQCVNYHGPDPDYGGAEICFDSNEDKISIVDVSIKAATRSIASLNYPNLGFTHQAWIDETHQFLIVNDETDEQQLQVRTSTIVMDVRDLDNPVYLYTHQGTTNAIDHNLYIVGQKSYEANYHSGLRLLNFTDLATDTFIETAFFDTYPEDNETGFDGAWSVYPFFASGNIIVSDIDRGLFILSEN